MNDLEYEIIDSEETDDGGEGSQALVTIEEQEIRLLENDLYSFTEDAWPVLEPPKHGKYSTFKGNWHVEAICDHLQAVTEGQLQNLVINIPPRHLKSLTTSVFWPAWAWTRDASIKWLFLSYGRNLVLRDAVKTRRLISSPWYQKRWGHKFQLAGDQNVKSYYETSAGGARLTSSFESDPTGEGGDVLVVDDPLRIDDANNMAAVEHVNEVWDGTLATRLNDPSTGARVIIMQRLHENDLTGHVLREGGWTHLYLPTEYESKRKCVTFMPSDLDEGGRPKPEAQPFFWDPRTDEGQLLHPERFPKREVDKLRLKGDFHFAGQQQQRPTPAGGGIFHEDWWQYYKNLPYGLDMLNDSCQSWDCSFKDLTSSSYVVCTIWARVGARIYLVYRLRKRMNLPDTLKAIESVSMMYPWVGPKYIEEKANGVAAIQILKDKIPGIIPVDVQGSKESRAAAVSYLIQAGNVFIPDPDDNPWVRLEYIPEFTSFPRGENDDQVDSTTQALYQHFHLRPPGEVPLIEILQAGRDAPMMESRRVF